MRTYKRLVGDDRYLPIAVVCRDRDNDGCPGLSRPRSGEAFFRSSAQSLISGSSLGSACRIMSLSSLAADAILSDRHLCPNGLGACGGHNDVVSLVYSPLTAQRGLRKAVRLLTGIFACLDWALVCRCGFEPERNGAPDVFAQPFRRVRVCRGFRGHRRQR